MGRLEWVHGIGLVRGGQVSDQVPASLDDEKAVLGAILVSKAALRVVTTDLGLKPEHFYLERHGAIYSAAQAAAASEGFADELTVAAKLPAEREYLATLTASVPAAGNAGAYGRRVIELAALRKKREGALEILAGVSEQDKDKIQSGILAVTTDLQAQAEPTTPDELADDMLRWLEEGPDENDGDVFQLPWPTLHRHCAGGFRRGQMVLITGWSGMGKSIVIGQLLKEWGGAGKRCLLMTTEMHRRELIARYLSGESGIPYEKIIRRRLTAQDWKKITPPMNRIPFHYHDAEGWSVDRILSAIVTEQADAVVVDPVNLIPRKSYDEAAEHARRLKEIAMRANCLVVLVAHLKDRMGDHHGKLPKPFKSDIRDSGMWFNNAHYVLVLHREQGEAGRKQRSGEIYFMKAREAEEGGVEVEFRPNRVRFDEAGTEEREQAEREPELFA